MGGVDHGPGGVESTNLIGVEVNRASQEEREQHPQAEGAKFMQRCGAISRYADRALRHLFPSPINTAESPGAAQK